MHGLDAVRATDRLAQIVLRTRREKGRSRRPSLIWNPFERIGAAVTTALISRVGSASWRDGSLRGADVNDARNDDILNAWFNGGTLTQIAFDYSVTRSTVSGVINRARERPKTRAPRRGGWNTWRLLARSRQIRSRRYRSGLGRSIVSTARRPHHYEIARVRPMPVAGRRSENAVVPLLRRRA